MTRLGRLYLAPLKMAAAERDEGCSLRADDRWSCALARLQRYRSQVMWTRTQDTLGVCHQDGVTLREDAMPQRERTLHHLRLCIAEAARRHTPAEIARAEALLETAGAGL